MRVPALKFIPTEIPMPRLIHSPLRLDPVAPIRSRRPDISRRYILLLASVILAASINNSWAQTDGRDEPTADAPKADATQPYAVIDTSGPGWRVLTEADFAGVNGDDQTMTWNGSQVLCSGTPIGVTRTKTKVRNFELQIEWRHLKDAGNSGVFAWVPESALDGLPPNKLPPGGIEVQMLDHGYTAAYAKRSGKSPDWFSTNGDIFAVGRSTMTPFPPLSPNGQRSFPTRNLSNGFGKWNHYYVRGINGEIRLWVNGYEVSGGSDCNPAEGYLCLEHEGSPIEFKNIRLRELP